MKMSEPTGLSHHERLMRIHRKRHLRLDEIDDDNLTQAYADALARRRKASDEALSAHIDCEVMHDEMERRNLSPQPYCA